MKQYQFDYDFTYTPSQPVLEVVIENPHTGETVDVQAIIDTGADFTLVPIDLLKQIRLKSVSSILVEGLNQVPRDLPLFPATIVIRDTAVGGLDVIGDPAFREVVLGRDFLNRFVITLDGLALTTTISQ